MGTQRVIAGVSGSVRCLAALREATTALGRDRTWAKRS
jgi:hypothetical protein